MINRCIKIFLLFDGENVDIYVFFYKLLKTFYSVLCQYTTLDKFSNGGGKGVDNWMAKGGDKDEKETRKNDSLHPDCNMTPLFFIYSCI